MLFEVPVAERKLLAGISAVEVELPNVKTWSRVVSAN